MFRSRSKQEAEVMAREARVSASFEELELADGRSPVPARLLGYLTTDAASALVGRPTRPPLIRSKTGGTVTAMTSLSLSALNVVDALETPAFTSVAHAASGSAGWVRVASGMGSAVGMHIWESRWASLTASTAPRGGGGGGSSALLVLSLEEGPGRRGSKARRLEVRRDPATGALVGGAAVSPAVKRSGTLGTGAPVAQFVCSGRWAQHPLAAATAPPRQQAIHLQTIPRVTPPALVAALAALAWPCPPGASREAPASCYAPFALLTHLGHVEAAAEALLR